jgi:hypothetical protein
VAKFASLQTQLTEPQARVSRFKLGRGWRKCALLSDLGKWSFTRKDEKQREMGGYVFKSVTMAIYCFALCYTKTKSAGLNDLLTTYLFSICYKRRREEGKTDVTVVTVVTIKYAFGMRARDKNCLIYTRLAQV